MTTPAPAVTEHDDFERQLLELRKRESGRPVPQWTRPGATAVG